MANNFSQEKFFGESTLPYFCSPNQKTRSGTVVGGVSQGSSFSIIFNAEVAQLVERNLAKVEVAGSSLVFRSKKKKPDTVRFFFNYL